jgi:hypothetical protein
MHGMAFSECRRGLITNQLVYSFLKHDKQKFLHDEIPLFWVKLSSPRQHGTATRRRFDNCWNGRGGSLTWPSRFTDLTFNFYLNGQGTWCIKGNRRKRVNSSEHTTALIRGNNESTRKATCPALNYSPLGSQCM